MSDVRLGSRRVDGSSRRTPITQPTGSYAEVKGMLLIVLRVEDIRKVKEDTAAGGIGRFHKTEYSTQLKEDPEVLEALSGYIGKLITAKRAGEASHALQVFICLDKPTFEILKYGIRE